MSELVIELGDGGKAIFKKVSGGTAIVLERNGKTRTGVLSDTNVEALIVWLCSAGRPTPVNIDEAVDQAMDAVRENYYLTDEVSRTASLEFLDILGSRISDLNDELDSELLKHGDG